MKQFNSKTLTTVHVLLLLCVAFTTSCSSSKLVSQVLPDEKMNAPAEGVRLLLAGIVIFPKASQTVSKYLGRNALPLWTPSTNTVAEALNQLPEYLQHANQLPLAHPAYSEQLIHAKERLPKSICQAVGITFEGREGVLLNFLPSDKTNAFVANWREHFVKVYDGGPDWWSVIYLKKEKTFTALHFDSGF